MSDAGDRLIAAAKDAQATVWDRILAQARREVWEEAAKLVESLPQYELDVQYDYASMVEAKREEGIYDYLDAAEVIAALRAKAAAPPA